MEFERRHKSSMRGLPLTPLIDVVFILIIFFMLTTTFMRIESLELVMPSAGGTPVEQQEVVKLYLFENGDMKLGEKSVDAAALEASLKELFSKDPATRMMVLVAEGVTMQQMVNAMDRINTLGGQSIFVRKWVKAKR